MRWLRLLFLGLLLSGCLPASRAQRLFTTAQVRVDRLTPIDQALQVGDKFLPIENQPGELIWLTGAEARCVSAEGVTLSDKFLGYSTLDFRWPEWHNEKFATSQSSRIFGLGRGLPKYELPEGYGIPLHSNEALWYTSRISNPDPYLPAQKLGQELELSYARRRDSGDSFRAVLVRPVEARQAGAHIWDLQPGTSSVRTEITNQLYLSDECRRLVGMTVWMLEPGRTVALLDLTTGDKLLDLNAKVDANGRIQEFEAFSDSQGILLVPEHRYALEATFEITSKNAAKGGAYLNLYLEDSGFMIPPR